MFEPSLTKGVLEVFSPVSGALSAADDQATKAIDIQHGSIHGETPEGSAEPHSYRPQRLALHGPSRFPSSRGRGVQRVGVFGEPGLLLLLRLLRRQRRHGDPPGAVQPGGAVRDAAGAHHLLAEPAESPPAAAGRHR